MTRLSICIALALALANSTFVTAQTPDATSTTTTTSSVGCVIATPKQHLTQGQPTYIEFQNCQGSGDVKLRYGNVKDLSADKTLACSNVQFTSTDGAKPVTCSFTPPRAGVYSLSTIDDRQVETFSGPFTVDPVAPAFVAGDKVVKDSTTGPHVSSVKDVAPGDAAPLTNKRPASAAPETEGLGGVPMGDTKQKGTAGSVIAKRALYDMTGFLVL